MVKHTFKIFWSEHLKVVELCLAFFSTLCMKKKVEMKKKKLKCAVRSYERKAILVCDNQ